MNRLLAAVATLAALSSLSCGVGSNYGSVATGEDVDVLPAETSEPAATKLVPSGDPCKRLDFGPPSDVPLVNLRTGQNIVAGVTPDGSSILLLRGGCSYGTSLAIADATPPEDGAYETLALPRLEGVDPMFEENVALTADGLTIIALNTDHTRFVTLARSRVGAVDFKPSPGDVAAIVAAKGDKLWAPVLSTDGLAFYYVVHGDPSRAGIYESVRASREVPFKSGTRLPQEIQSVAQYVNGLSDDRLTIFVEASASWETLVFSRPRADAPFTNPLAPEPPPRAPGMRTRPIEGCTRLVGTFTPRGCASEKVSMWLSR